MRVDLPELHLDSQKMPTIAQNISKAQENGAPSTLTKITDTSAIRENRRNALRGIPSTPSGFSRDEYPFASTLEGGVGASVMTVSNAEHSLQAVALSNFYRTITDGDRFEVIIDW